jgi:hypothetical protein
MDYIHVEFVDIALMGLKCQAHVGWIYKWRGQEGKDPFHT